MRNWLTAVVVLGSILLTTAVALAQTDPERDSLRGIGPIAVGVENMYPETERDGLTQRGLQTAVELRLRRNGIPLDDTFRYFYVRVTTLKNDAGGFYAFNLTAELKQPVTASNGVVIIAATWATPGLLGMVRTENLRDVRDDVLDAVDEFSNDYLAVNPSP